MASRVLFFRHDLKMSMLVIQLTRRCFRFRGVVIPSAEGVSLLWRWSAHVSGVEDSSALETGRAFEIAIKLNRVEKLGNVLPSAKKCVTRRSTRRKKFHSFNVPIVLEHDFEIIATPMLPNSSNELNTFPARKKIT